MRTPAVTGFGVTIEDDGTAWVSAADAEKEGHGWAITRRQVTLSQVRHAANTLGADVFEGVEKRLAMVLDRQEREVERLEALVERSREAKARVASLRADLGVS